MTEAKKWEKWREIKEQRVGNEITRTLFYGVIINFVIITVFMSQPIYYIIFFGSLLAGYLLNLVFIFFHKEEQLAEFLKDK